MIHLPQPPSTFTTLQIPCVACREVFTVAEAFQTPNGQWRLPADHNPSVPMRYEDNLSRQPMRSVTRADPEINPNTFRQNQPDTYVNCPRCGADNRNWLQLRNPRLAPVPFTIKYLPRGILVWRQKFYGAYLSIIIAIILAPITWLMAAAVQAEAWGLILALAVFLAALFTAVDLTSKWRGLRLDDHIRAVMPTKRSQEAKLWRRGVTIIFLLAFIIPIVFFQMAPRALGVVSRFLRDTPKTAVQAGQRQLNQLNQNYDELTLEIIQTAIADIEKIEQDKELGSDEIQKQITARLDELQADLETQSQLILSLAQKDIDAQIQHLEAFVAESERLVDEKRTHADAAAINDISGDIKFMGLWSIMVGLSSLASVVMSMRAIKDYAAAVDSVLPHPIFSNITDMTRVTIWEAKRSLQIDNDMSHIQWTEATRNGTGGIDLIGLHRAAPDKDTQGNLISPTVRAQRYVIQTDMWGRILNTIVRDVRVPQSIPNNPIQRESHLAQSTNPPPDYITISPDSPTGDDLAQGFFASQDSSPEPEREEATVHAVTPQSVENTPEEASLTPSPQPGSTLAPELETPLNREERLQQQFVHILSKQFTGNELQKLYTDIGLDYDRFPGTHLEKCQDLVWFTNRRQRLTELIEMAINMHPYLLWGEIFDFLDQ